MHRCLKKAKRYLSFILSFLLLAQSIGGNAVTAKAAEPDKTNIQVNVADNQGNAMSGIEAELIDVSASNDVVATLTSGTDGAMKYSVSGLQNGDYRLKIPFRGEYMCNPNAGYLIKVADGQIISVDSKAYDGEVLEFVLTSIDGGETDTSQPDEKTLIINVTDTDGKPFNEKIFVVVDSEFPTQEGMKKQPENGVLKVTVDSNVKSGEIRVASALSEQYKITPEKITFTSENKVFKTVNDEKYNGTEIFAIRVEKDNTSSENKGEITAMLLDKESLPSDGGEVTLQIAGKKLQSNVAVEVYHTTSSEKLSAVNVLNTDTLQKFTIQVPENTSTESKNYMVSCRIKDDLLSTQVVDFTVAGKKMEESEDVTSDAVVETVEVTPDSVTEAGGKVSLKITGTGLTANNWGVSAKAYIAGTDVSMADRFKVEITDKTENGATVVIPANSMRNDIEYRITVGGLKGGSVQNQASAAVFQNAKGASVQVNPKLVEMTDNFTIIATMEQDVKFGLDDMEALKKKIYIADFGSAGSNRLNLTANDQVSIEGNQITIAFEETPEIKSNSSLYVEEGAFKTMDGVNVKAFSWLIVSKSMITEIVLEDSILEHAGGAVEGVLKGVRLDEAPVITAKIMKAGSVQATDIPVTIGTGAEPSIYFELPENNTERTESYIINLTMGDTPVYVEEVVSVLAEGASDTEQTLAALTISGNNKIYTNENSTEITVKVSKQVGELKTRLNLYGTNLNSKWTEVRAIDQNGIVWPVYHIPE